MLYTKQRSHIVIILFLVLLVVPNLIMLTDLENKSQFANLTEYPDIEFESNRSYLVKLKKYYLEHFGLKSSFVDLYINFKSDVLHENPLPNRVVKGSDDWYFLGNHHNNVINNTFGMRSYSDMDLQIMKQNLLALNTYLSSLNIPLYLVIPPNKSTIYKKQLPFNIKQNPSPISQFLQNVNPSDQLNIIDLRAPLLNDKSGKQLFHKTDTHWNSYGAYVAYSFIMEYLNKDIGLQNVVPLSYFDINNNSFQGDITRMINHYEKETFEKYINPEDSKVETIKDTDEYYMFQNPARDLKLLFFRDSFAYELFPFLNESFNQTVYIKYEDVISKSEIENENPDLVILEVSERNIDVFLKKLRLVK